MELNYSNLLFSLQNLSIESFLAHEGFSENRTALGTFFGSCFLLGTESRVLKYMEATD